MSPEGENNVFSSSEKDRGLVVSVAVHVLYQVLGIISTLSYRYCSWFAIKVCMPIVCV